MTSNGFAPIRRGMLRHAEDGRMAPAEFAAYINMIMRANRETGVWWGSARALSFAFNRGLSERAARRVMEELEGDGYIKRFAKPGAHGNYAIVINRYECTDGARKGMRIDAAKTTDWRSPAVFEDRVIGPSGDRAITEGLDRGEILRHAQGNSPRGESAQDDIPGEANRKIAKSPNRQSGRRPELFVPCIAHARETWTEKFKSKPSWSGKDEGQLAGLLRRRKDLTLEEFGQRWARYLDDDDRFTARQGYSLAWFCSRFDSYTEALAGGIPDAPSPY